MCGINGFINKHHSNKVDIQSTLSKMNQLIRHRGPDDDGFFIENHMGMAMRRLSIIDLKTGKQPIFNEDKSIVIVFNGEIYNYQKLRTYLLNLGVSFKTKSDTEVILKLYEKEGVESFKKLDGMFAFSIMDKNTNKIYITRDFFGEKPLYYYSDDNIFIWGSELKSIIGIIPHKPEINITGLNLFFKLTYIPAPFTIYQNIHKLKANHYITYNLSNNTFKINTISDDTIDFKKQHISLKKAKEQTHELVMQSIESRSVSDVPLGTFLSGGVDSSIVSLGLSKISNAKINTFSIGFEKASFDETEKSRLVAKLINSNHNEFIVNENDIKNDLNEILLNFDEPFADGSALPTYLVSKMTREHVKVALTGDGGDEVFGGYNKYYIGRLNNKYTSLVPKFMHDNLKGFLSSLLSTKDDERGLRFKLKRLVNAVNYDYEHYWDIISLGFTNDHYLLLKPDKLIVDPLDYYKKITSISKPKSLDEYREIDRHVSLEGDMLVKVDRTSMLNFLECRAPFLNKGIWEFTNSLPEKYLINGWDKKHILKEAFKYEFPKKFLDKSKKGFVVPVGDWLRSSLRHELETYIDTKFLEEQNIFNIDFIRKLVTDHLEGKEDNSYKVWTYYTFQKWYCNIYV